MAATATAVAAGAGAGAGGGEEEKGHQLYVLALPLSLPLAAVVARIDAGVPRRARSARARAEPAGWWAFRLPVVTLVKEGKKNSNLTSPEEEDEVEEGEKAPRVRPLSVCLGLGAPTAADLEGERPAKRARMCVQCGSAETPHWRSGPMGRSTLCNACGVRLRAAGALREAVELGPPPTTPPRKVPVTPPPAAPPESPDSDSDSPISPRRPPLGDIYLVRKNPRRERRTPRKDSSPPSSSSPSPSSAIYLVRKKKPSKKPWRPRNTGQRCLHCGTTSTPQWREGPMGRHTLCNACGVRYRQGRLLPEYRPSASPTFVPSEHASRHREVLQLHRQRGGGSTKTMQRQRKQELNNLLPVATDEPESNEEEEDDKNNVFLVRRQPLVDKYPPTPLHRPLLQPADDDPCGGGGDNKGTVAGTGCGDGPPVDDDPRGGCVDNKGAMAAAAGCGDGQTDTLDSLLLDGPSAPLIVDGGGEFLSATSTS